MPPLHYDLEAMDSTSQMLYTGAQDLIAATRRFQSLVTNLLAEGYVAPSGQAFGGVFGEWCVQADQATAALDLLATNLKGTSTTVAQVDSDIAGKLSKS